MSNYTMQWPFPGLGDSGAYQASGIPFVTGGLTFTNSAPVQINFPSVSKTITVANNSVTSGYNMRVGFSSAGINGSNYFILGPGESFTQDLRVTSLFLISNDGSAVTASVIAGLTQIPSTELLSNWSGSVGVG